NTAMGTSAQGPESLVGKAVGGYQLTRSLGVGGSGAVFLGERLPTTPAVSERTGAFPILLPDQAAIKVLILPWQLSADERAEFHKRFIREAQTLQRLQHPYIVSVLAYGEDLESGHTYMVLPYLSGGTLAQRLRDHQAPLPLDSISGYLAPIAEA